MPLFYRVNILLIAIKGGSLYPDLLDQLVGAAACISVHVSLLLAAGICLVTNKSALLWTDGRYHIQASKELGEEWTLMKAGCDGVPTLAKWMKTVPPIKLILI